MGARRNQPQLGPLRRTLVRIVRPADVNGRVVRSDPSPRYRYWVERLMAGAVDIDASTARDLVERIQRDQLSRAETSRLDFTISSMLINNGSDRGESESIEFGQQLAADAADAAESQSAFQYQCLYNVANSIEALCALRRPSGTRREEWQPELVAIRFDQRADLQRARMLFLTIGEAAGADNRTRSSAYCNLANDLDHAGRWAEAYDYYLRALEADATNGNAAGNLAQLLQGRMATGRGLIGHLAAVYDQYVVLAQSLRDGTAAFAGDTVAQRWDALPLTGSAGHVEHGLDEGTPDDDYRRWVADHRLALSPAVQGLGSEHAHWDTAVIEMLFGETPEDVTPPILAEMNVLKSDFLVSRRLAYEGYVGAIEGPSQEASDSGYYVETYDYSLFGTKFSKLTLAQRSALDTLDKTAVVANEYFGLGDRPASVSFRKFWTTKDGDLRLGLVKSPGRGLAALALAELALDMEQGGCYSPAQALRNAGTHRIVHAAVADDTGVTLDSRSRIHVVDLVDSTIAALQVTRSAYLYLIDLVAAWNDPADVPDGATAFQSEEYLTPEEDGSAGLDEQR